MFASLHSICIYEKHLQEVNKQSSVRKAIEKIDLGLVLARRRRRIKKNNNKIFCLGTEFSASLYFFMNLMICYSYSIIKEMVCSAGGRKGRIDYFFCCTALYWNFPLCHRVFPTFKVSAFRLTRYIRMTPAEDCLSSW